ncbi:MAG: type I restriction-modification system subunit M [Rhodospirillales bacterium]|nr:type I restriction-modification system subunit M [Rhodospirillales bacterium]
MTGDEKRQLHGQLWKVADELRGRMDADDFRDYILGFVFLKYLSGKVEACARELLETEEGAEYADLVPGSEKAGIIRKECIDRLGYFIAPDRLFGVLVQRGKDGAFILDDIKETLTGIENSATGQDSEKEFIHLFEDMDLDNSRLGRTPGERNRLIARVIAHLDGIDFHMGEGRGDVLGDAYEYLIGQFASGAGKKAGEFYTPARVSTLLAKLVGHGRGKIRAAYDPACGSGSLLLRIGQEVEVGSFHGQELNRTTYNLARMNMLLHNIHYSRFDIRQGDTLEEPAHRGQSFDAIVANPPFSAKWKGDRNPLNANDERFARYGRIAPASKADYAFVQHCVHHLADNGTAAVILPHGVLFRGAAEAAIREHIVREMNVLDAVIGLPHNLFYGTSITACVLVLKTCRERDGDILFIDASREFEKDGNKNTLTAAHVDRILATWAARQEVERYAHAAPMVEIEENGFNLNIPRYVDGFEEEEPVDLAAVASDLLALDREAADIDREIAGFCAELGIAPPFKTGGAAKNGPGRRRS